MAASKNDDRILQERDVLAKARQYDIELLFAAPLQSMQLTSLGSALTRCASLTVLDVSRNALRSLAGLGGDTGACSQLQFLNAAENVIEDVAAVSQCPALERVWLEGNQLRTKASLLPLTKLAHLNEVRLQRSISVDGAPLVLDNPVCAADTKAYIAICNELFSSVRWVDDKAFRDGASEYGVDSVAQVETAQKEMKDACASLERITSEAQSLTAEERSFEKLLSK